VKELDRFVDWLVAEQQKPDIVCLSNVLLAGMTSRLKQKLGAPVVCLLQDEDGFLDGLAASHAEQAWGIVRERARDIDAFLSVSQYFSGVMATRLRTPPERMHVLYMGIDPDEYAPGDESPAVPTIGFLSRMCPDRGLERLVDAFILVKKNHELQSARLRVCGGRSAADEPFIQRLRDKLATAGILNDAEFIQTFARDSKLEFLQSLSVLSVPETKPVAYGLYVLEALAMGVPVVQPAIGCFPETIALTGGGVLYEPNTTERLAQVLAPLLSDPQAARQLGAAGRSGVLRAFNIERTANEMVRICEQVVRQSERGE
jgi:glycosyltransferase involved in cell wall biosynthesis